METQSESRPRSDTRLTELALLVLGAGVLYVGLGTPPAPGERTALVLVGLGLAAALSVALLVADRSRRVTDAQRWRLGLACGVLLALAVALVVAAYPPGPAGVRGGLSPVAVFAVVLPLLVRAPRAPTLWAVGAAVLAEPLAWLATGAAWPAASAAALWFAPHLGAVGLAWLIASRGAGARERSMVLAEVGNYALVEVLAQGGMGEVWRAEHRFLDRPAAVKLIKMRGAASDAQVEMTVLLKRFEREVQATARLTSPHTVQIYDYGTVGDGTFYYAMELLDGVDFFTLVSRYGPQPAERVVHLLRQACESLHEAHQAGLVHRDVKPGNLLTCRVGDRLDFVKVVDFGFVTQKGGGDPRVTRLTRHGVAPGTPAFMAPEIARGQRAIDGRADLYSLGCVAFWLLTGRVVFTAPTSAMMLVAHVKERPKPPSEVARQPVPADLDELVLECLAKDPAQRPETALALSSRLERLDLEKFWTPDLRARWWAENRPERRVRESRDGVSPRS